jgi:HK97 family phage major capsid protein
MEQKRKEFQDLLRDRTRRFKELESYTSRSLTTSEQKDYDEKRKALVEVDAQIDLLRNFLEFENSYNANEERNRKLVGIHDRSFDGGVADYSESDGDYEVAFRSYILNGVNRMDPGLARVLAQGEVRNLGTTSGSIGGYTVPQGFWSDVQEAQVSVGGLRAAPITLVPTDTGNDVPIPTGDDTANEGELLAQNSATSTTSTDPVFGQVILKAWQWSSKIVRVHRDLLQDNGVKVEGLLAKWLGKRIGRIQANYFIDGTGTNEPEGIMTNITVGATSDTTGSFTFDDLIELEMSVDPYYRERGVYILSDNALKTARLLKDNDDRPIWLPASVAGNQVGVPSTINGRRYFVDLGMSDGTTSGDQPIIFGDVSTYWIREVSNPTLLRMEERFGEFNQVGFLLFTRADARPVEAGDDPYKALEIL